MSVKRTDYLMLAVEVTKDFNNDDFEAELDGADDRRFDLVYDGMCGEYTLAGKIIAKSTPFDGFEMIKINLSRLGIDRAELAGKISEALGQRVSPDDFSLVLFSHYT